MNRKENDGAMVQPTLLPAGSSGSATMRLVCLGDVFPGGVMSPLCRQERYRPFGPAVDRILHCADVVFCNLEAPLTDHSVPETVGAGKILLRANPGCAYILQDMSVKVVSLANNHMMDFGVVGLVDTLN